MHASNGCTMPDAQKLTFEEKLDRIERIVKELQAGAPLEKAVALFKESQVLARECEAELKVAQEAIKSMGDGKT